ncbi:MAG: response regulator transcription factor [Myxococcota bacterium]|nr:response regulator transcription factor [Myxococcota bacterium]
MSLDAQILFVEDDETIAMAVVNALRLSGMVVHHYTSAEAALAETVSWDLAILDVMLPGMDGIALLQHLKTEQPNNPVIMLTAKSSTDDIVQGLDQGADDYITKPPRLLELLARVRVQLRTQDDEEPEGQYSFDTFQVDLRRQVITKDGQEIHLTTHENAVLQYLIVRTGTEVSRNELLKEVWGYAPTMVTRTVDNQILKLRKKIEDNPSRPRYILTVHGKGYRFEN